MRQLVSSWVEAEKDGYGHSVSEAIAYLSHECGITLNHSRLAEWRAGKYTPSPAVITQMLYRVLPWALLKVGFEPTDAQLDALEDLLFAVKRGDGDRQIELPRRTACAARDVMASGSKVDASRLVTG